MSNIEVLLEDWDKTSFKKKCKCCGCFFPVKHKNEGLCNLCKRGEQK